MTKTFGDILAQFPLSLLESQRTQAKVFQVTQALRQAKRQRSLAPEMLMALLSPSAEPFLEEMAQLSCHLTRQRFGQTIQMYVPLYLSNECLCHCTYCGYSKENIIPRLTLTPQQILAEGTFLHQQGFRHILLLSGEDRRFVNTQTLCEAARLLRPLFSSLAVEVQPLKTQEYQKLIEAGVDGVTVYQETYQRERYQTFHLAGRKKDYDYRLATPERAGAAGMRKINIGALLGLSRWYHDSFYVAMHAAFLEKHYWRSHISVSLPRMRQAVGKSGEFDPVSDRHFVQAITALRLFLPNAGLVLSTRETANFRDHVFSLGFTQMSAGSRTTPGGYIEENHSGAQFEIEDRRSAAEVVAMLQQQGFDPVWKDWDPVFLQQSASAS